MLEIFTPKRKIYPAHRIHAQMAESAAAFLALEPGEQAEFLADLQKPDAAEARKNIVDGLRVSRTFYASQLEQIDGALRLFEQQSRQAD